MVFGCAILEVKSHQDSLMGIDGFGVVLTWEPWIPGIPGAPLKPLRPWGPGPPDDPGSPGSPGDPVEDTVCIHFNG